MTLNLDRMPTPEARIAYTFSRTSSTAQGYIVPKIQARLYQDWTDVLPDLKNAFFDPDPEFFAQRKLIELCQANKTFAKFYTELSKYAGRSELNDKALKYVTCGVLFQKNFFTSWSAPTLRTLAPAASS